MFIRRLHNIRLLRDARYDDDADDDDDDDDDDGDGDDDDGVDANVGLQLVCRKPISGHSCNFL